MAYCLQQIDPNSDCSHSSSELDQTAKTFFPKVYYARKQNFQSAPCAKWPLPSCRKRFRTFWGEKVFVIVVLAFFFFYLQRSFSVIFWQWSLWIVLRNQDAASEKRWFSLPLDVSKKIWKTCLCTTDLIFTLSSYRALTSFTKKAEMLLLFPRTI